MSFVARIDLSDFDTEHVVGPQGLEGVGRAFKYARFTTQGGRGGY